MSDVKHLVNAKTSILGRQYTMAVTFFLLVTTFLCLNVSFWAKHLLEMPQNGKLLILTTKVNDKTV